MLPGVGSFTDSSGNTYSIDPNSNTAMINGVPITPNGESTNTSQMTMVAGRRLWRGRLQPTNGSRWLPGPGGDRPWAWSPVAALPPAGQSPVGDGPLEYRAGSGNDEPLPGTASSGYAGYVPAAQPSHRHPSRPLPRSARRCRYRWVASTINARHHHAANSIGGTQ